MSIQSSIDTEQAWLEPPSVTYSATSNIAGDQYREGGVNVKVVQERLGPLPLVPLGHLPLRDPRHRQSGCQPVKGGRPRRNGER
jgi:hypothetical protein